MYFLPISSLSAVEKKAWLSGNLKGDLKELDVPNELSELLIKLSTREK